MVDIIAPVGTELLVHSLTGGTQINSSVTALSNGGFVVTWSPVKNAESRRNALVLAGLK